MKKYLFFLLLAISCIGIAQQVKIVPFKYGGQWGLVDSKKNEILSPEYSVMSNIHWKYYILRHSKSYETKVYNAETAQTMDLGSYQKYCWDMDKYLFITIQKTSFLYDFDKNEKISFEGTLKNIEVLKIDGQKYFLGKNGNDNYSTLYSYEDNPKILMKDIFSCKMLYDEKGESVVAVAIKQGKDLTAIYSIYDSKLNNLGKSTLEKDRLNKLLNRKIELEHVSYIGIADPESSHYIPKGTKISDNLKIDAEGNLVDIKTNITLISTSLGVNYRKLEDGIIKGYKLKDDWGKSIIEFYIDTTGKYFPKEVPMIPSKYLQ